MARARNPENEGGRLRTKKWRDQLQASGGWETFEVDTAICGAASLYLRQALISQSESDLRRVEGFELMAAILLAAKDREDALDAIQAALVFDAALKRVRGRFRRSDVDTLFRIVDSETRKKKTIRKVSALPVTL